VGPFSEALFAARVAHCRIGVCVWGAGGEPDDTHLETDDHPDPLGNSLLRRLSDAACPPSSLHDV
jgi:hypothetical protein